MLTPSDRDAIWRTTVETPLPVRVWDGDYVVYNPLSGSTHLLDIVTGEVLTTIMASRVRANELCRHVADFLEVPHGPGVEERISKILRTLDDIGLIEPADGC